MLFFRQAKFFAPFLDGKNRPPHQVHPCTIARPWNRRPLREASAQPARALHPPHRLAHDPSQPASFCIAELAHESKSSNTEKLRGRASHDHAPEFVACVKMMCPHF